MAIKEYNGKTDTMVGEKTTEKGHKIYLDDGYVLMLGNLPRITCSDHYSPMLSEISRIEIEKHWQDWLQK